MHHYLVSRIIKNVTKNETSMAMTLDTMSQVVPKLFPE